MQPNNYQPSQDQRSPYPPQAPQPIPDPYQALYNPATQPPQPPQPYTSPAAPAEVHYQKQPQVAPVPQPATTPPLSDFERRFREHVAASVTMPPKKKAAKWPLIVLSLLVLLGSGGAAAAYYLLKEPTAEERFTLALENHLRVQFIDQHYEMEGELGEESLTASIESVMDISDPSAPKVAGSYTLAGTGNLTRKTDFNIPSKDKGYVRFSEFSADTLTINKAALNQWYEYDTSTFISSLVLEPLQVGKMIATPTGEMIVGSFSEDERAKIMDQINSASPYNILSHTDEGETIKYTIELNKENSLSLNKLVASLTEMDYDSEADVSMTQPTTAEIWVNKTTNQFVKYAAKKDKQSVVVTIGYPTAYTASTPEGALPEAKFYELSSEQ